MTEIIVQYFVENLLKLLKLLKTRTALTMNGLSRIPLRSIRQGAKAPFKTKEQGRGLQNYYNHQKSLKKLLTSDIIKSEEERTVLRMTLKSYRIEMTNTKTGKKEVRHTLAESKKLAKCLIWTREDIISQWKINKIEED